MTTGSGFVLLVAAASVTQIVQFTVNLFAGSPVPLLYTSSAPPVRYCAVEEKEAPVCEPAYVGLLADPGEKEILYGSSAASLALGAFLSALTGLHRCCQGTQEAIAIVNNGRGSQLQNQRAGGRGRLSVAPTGALGSSLV